MSTNEKLTSSYGRFEDIKNKYVVSVKEWFKSQARQSMILFRFSGVLIIILSVSIPFLVTFEWVWKDIVLSIVALTIAGLTGINSFFKWESAWRGYRQTQFALEHLLAIWELKMIEAKNCTDLEEGLKMAMNATEQLLKETRGVTSTETEDYFKHVQMPQIKST